jgi:hypothetical protein
MKEIADEEKAYKDYPLPVFYHFSSRVARERILYANFNRVNKDVDEMIKEIQLEYPKSSKEDDKKDSKSQNRKG